MLVRRLVVALVVVAVGALSAPPATAVEGPSAPGSVVTSPAQDTALGTRLVNRFFTALQKQDAKALDALLSPAFQVARADGSTSTKAQYLAALPKVEKYALDDFVVTRAGRNLVARYSVVTSETINGEVLSRDPALRLSVFVRDGGAWQLLAHSNFNVPVKAS
jgi:hypothetical protein